MTQLEILELAYEGAIARHTAATKAYIKAVINAVPGSSSGEAAKTYWNDTSREIHGKMAELFELLEVEKAKPPG